AALDPVGMTERYHTETLLRMPAAAPFTPAADSPPVNLLPALTAGCFTFACLNQLTKISERMIALWAEILAALPHARLMLGNANDDASRDRLLTAFARHGVAPERIAIQPRLPLRDYLALHHAIDLGLDSFPYNGGTTTCHALAMGVPVVTLAGDTPISRAGQSILHGIGLPEFVVRTEDEYVRRAIAVAGDLPRLAALRQTLRDRVTPPASSSEIHLARPFEAILRDVWGRWCDRAGAAG
ncbi:MAG: O-linked N-acetylglucosamine transferase family protein, partial [Burkholderiaceae bacterium]